MPEATATETPATVAPVQPAPAMPPAVVVTETGDDDDAPLDVRVERVKEQSAARKAAKAKEDDAEAAATAKAKPAKPGEAPAPELAQAKADRDARLATLRKKDAEDAERQKARAEHDAKFKTLEDEKRALEKRLADLESVSPKDEAGLIALARKQGMSRAKIAELLMQQGTNAGDAAVEKLKAEALSPLEQRLAAKEKEIDAKLQALEDAEKGVQGKIAEQQATTALIGLARTNARIAPLSATFLEKRGEEAFYRLAVRIAKSNDVPPGAGLQGLHDAIEQELENYQLTNPTAGASPTSSTKPSNAAAQAKTLSNALTTDRTSVPEEENFEDMTLDERVAAATRHAEARARQSA